MAAIDSLLNLMVAQRADALIIVDGEAPILERKGERIALSMPSLDRELVSVFIDEVVPADRQSELANGGALEEVYAAGDGAAYRARVEIGGGRRGRLRIELRTGGKAKPKPRAPSRARPPVPTRAAPPASAAASPPPSPTDHEGAGHRVASPVAAAPVAPVAAPEAAFALEELAGGTYLVDEGPLRQLLARAIVEEASDVIISAGLEARMRVGGSLIELRGVVFELEEIVALLDAALSPAGRRRFAAAGSVDLPLEVELDGVLHRMRGNAFRQHRGIALNLRPIRETAPTLRQLNLPDELSQLVEHRHGLVLLCGPTGSGKSSTLVALVEHLNRTRACHVITLEDPIEHVYAPKRALIHQREVGVQVESFADGLRAALRESPDVILVGEMRDHATIAAALTAAETGHLVLSTLHSADAVMAIDRIIDVFPAEQQRQVRIQLADVLRAVVTQVLLPARRAPLRVPAIERMYVTAAIAHSIREERTHQLRSLIQTGRAEGMLTLEQSMSGLVRAGLLDANVARAAARSPELLEGLMRR
ncbi:MAG: PilT/PilU family type 4a pilus ATPase [Nannocystaceae bacterium]